MLSFLWPSYPVNARQKAWTETRLQWLCKHFGRDRLHTCEVLLPTDECFSAVDETEDSVRELFAELCRRMEIDASKLTLEFVPDVDMRGAAGLYQASESGANICVAKSQLADWQRLVATLIHELSHRVLLGSGKLTSDVSDHEYVTDLYAVFVGMGIFAANAVVQESFENTGRSYRWSIGKQGYMTAREYGYALAVCSWIQQERHPTWSDFLRLDAKAAYVRGVRYLRRTGDCLLCESNSEISKEMSVSVALAGLSSRFEGTRVATLWTVRDMRLSAPEVVDRVIAQLQHKNSVVRTESARTLEVIAGSNRLATEVLIALERSRLRSSCGSRSGFKGAACRAQTCNSFVG